MRKIKNRRYFYTGLISLLPLVITVGIFGWLFKLVLKIVRATFITEILKKILYYIYGTNINSDHFIIMIYIISIIIMIVIIWLVGFATKTVVLNVLADRINKLISKLPVVNTIYNTTKQIVKILSENDKSTYQQVVLLEYPRCDIYTLGFLTSKKNNFVKNATKREENMVNVFMPTSPNPTSGFMVCVPESKVIYIDMPVETAFKLIVSVGFVSDDISKI